MRRFRDRSFGFANGAGRPDVHPNALETYPVKPALLDGAIPKLVQREAALRRAIEQTRMRDRNACEDERRDAPATLAGQPARRIHLEVAGAIITDARCDGGDE